MGRHVVLFKSRRESSSDDHEAFLAKNNYQIQTVECLKFRFLNNDKIKELIDIAPRFGADLLLVISSAVSLRSLEDYFQKKQLEFSEVFRETVIYVIGKTSANYLIENLKLVPKNIDIYPANLEELCSNIRKDYQTKLSPKLIIKLQGNLSKKVDFYPLTELSKNFESDLDFIQVYETIKDHQNIKKWLNSDYDSQKKYSLVFYSPSCFECFYESSGILDWSKYIAFGSSTKNSMVQILDQEVFCCKSPTKESLKDLLSSFQ